MPVLPQIALLLLIDRPQDLPRAHIRRFDERRRIRSTPRMGRELQIGPLLRCMHIDDALRRPYPVMLRQPPSRSSVRPYHILPVAYIPVPFYPGEIDPPLIPVPNRPVPPETKGFERYRHFHRPPLINIARMIERTIGLDRTQQPLCIPAHQRLPAIPVGLVHKKI